MNKVKMV